MNEKKFIITQRNGGWCVVRQHTNRILSKQNSKEEAIRKAISLAYRERDTCEIILR